MLRDIIITISVFIAGILIMKGIGLMLISNETPNERVVRINRMANHECTKHHDEMAKRCFESYYKSIEDRN